MVRVGRDSHLFRTCISFAILSNGSYTIVYNCMSVCVYKRKHERASLSDRVFIGNGMRCEREIKENTSSSEARYIHGQSC